MRALLLTVAASLVLVACGRMGPVRPPGPREAVTYPRGYPAPTAKDREELNERRAAQGLPPLPTPP
ncbi:hypothetical protein [Sediminicoccus sp. KRV36]|uniref:hypothetical protein n=1 Tax=Sediminicoccus sp. KRV36 TaxID=3133721 RepID=UPI00200F9F04|nr:hypothetical protein [Sediminicoccus rosea]UPY39431.1 hypothetical protein LHU95_19395 [Sediminicoccus rosea]